VLSSRGAMPSASLRWVHDCSGGSMGRALRARFLPAHRLLFPPAPSNLMGSRERFLGDAAPAAHATIREAGKPAQRHRGPGTGSRRRAGGAAAHGRSPRPAPAHAEQAGPMLGLCRAGPGLAVVAAAAALRGVSRPELRDEPTHRRRVVAAAGEHGPISKPRAGAEVDTRMGAVDRL
jgi:hypothetical protein